MLTPAQLKMARAALDWSREILAEKSGTSAETIKNYELRGADAKGSTLMKWRRALSAGGVMFVEEDDYGGPGVRLKAKPSKRVYDPFNDGPPQKRGGN